MADSCFHRPIRKAPAGDSIQPRSSPPLCAPRYFAPGWVAALLGAASKTQRWRSLHRALPMQVRTRSLASHLRVRPNSAVRLPLTAPPARRSHCRRAIVPTAASRRCLCHGSDSRIDCVVVTVGDHRAVCSPNRRLLTHDRGFAASRLPERAQRPAGVASETWTGSGPSTSENAETCVAAGSGRQLRREGRGRRRATRARRFGVLRCLDVRAPVTSTEPASGQDAGLALASLRRSRRG